MSTCAARLHAISSRPRRWLEELRVRLLRSSLWVERSGVHSGRSRRNRINHPA
ncbi:MAG: hypothetical protein V3T81_05225 [Thermoanaerobaculia bacterium]